MNNPSQKSEHLQYLLTAYVFDNLSAAGKVEVESHLQKCAQCRQALNELRLTLALAESAFDEGGKTYVFEERRRQRVMDAARASRYGLFPRMERKILKIAPWKLASAAAMVLVLAVGGILLFSATGTHRYAAKSDAAGAQFRGIGSVLSGYDQDYDSNGSPGVERSKLSATAGISQDPKTAGDLIYDRAAGGKAEPEPQTPDDHKIHSAQMIEFGDAQDSIAGVPNSKGLVTKVSPQTSAAQTPPLPASGFTAGRVVAPDAVPPPPVAAKPPANPQEVFDRDSEGFRVHAAEIDKSAGFALPLAKNSPPPPTAAPAAPPAPVVTGTINVTPIDDNVADSQDAIRLPAIRPNLSVARGPEKVLKKGIDAKGSEANAAHDAPAKPAEQPPVAILGGKRAGAMAAPATGGEALLGERTGKEADNRAVMERLQKLEADNAKLKSNLQGRSGREFVDGVVGNDGQTRPLVIHGYFDHSYEWNVQKDPTAQASPAPAKNEDEFTQLRTEVDRLRQIERSEKPSDRPSVDKVLESKYGPNAGVTQQGGQQNNAWRYSIADGETPPQSNDFGAQSQDRWARMSEREKATNVEQIARWQKDQIAEKQGIVKHQTMVDRRTAEKGEQQRGPAHDPASRGGDIAAPAEPLKQAQLGNQFESLNPQGGSQPLALDPASPSGPGTAPDEIYKSRGTFGNRSPEKPQPQVAPPATSDGGLINDAFSAAQGAPDTANPKAGYLFAQPKAEKHPLTFSVGEAEAEKKAEPSPAVNFSAGGVATNGTDYAGIQAEPLPAKNSVFFVTPETELAFPAAKKKYSGVDDNNGGIVDVAAKNKPAATEGVTNSPNVVLGTMGFGAGKMSKEPAHSGEKAEPVPESAPAYDPVPKFYYKNVAEGDRLPPLEKQKKINRYPEGIDLAGGTELRYKLEQNTPETLAPIVPLESKETKPAIYDGFVQVVPQTTYTAKLDDFVDAFDIEATRKVTIAAKDSDIRSKEAFIAQANEDKKKLEEANKQLAAQNELLAEKNAQADVLLDAQVKLSVEKNAKGMSDVEYQAEKERVTQELTRLKGVVAKQQQAVPNTNWAEGEEAQISYAPLLLYPSNWDVLSPRGKERAEMERDLERSKQELDAAGASRWFTQNRPFAGPATFDGTNGNQVENRNALGLSIEDTNDNDYFVALHDGRRKVERNFTSEFNSSSTVKQPSNGQAVARNFLNEITDAAGTPVTLPEPRGNLYLNYKSDTNQQTDGLLEGTLYHRGGLANEVAGQLLPTDKFPSPFGEIPRPGDNGRDNSKVDADEILAAEITTAAFTDPKGSVDFAERLERIARYNNPDIHVSRIMQGQQKDDAKDTFMIEGQVRDQRAMTEFFSVVDNMVGGNGKFEKAPSDGGTLAGGRANNSNRNIRGDTRSPQILKNSNGRLLSFVRSNDEVLAAAQAQASQELTLRGFRTLREDNPKLTLRDYAKRPVAPTPAPLTDEGLDEDEYINRHGIRPFVDASRDHLSTFSMDVDTASYTRARALLRDGKIPDAEAVRTEEFVNYFKQAYAVCTDEAFGVFAEGGPSPFGSSQNLELLKIGIKSRDPKADERRAAVLTIVVDTSGSMGRGNGGVSAPTKSSDRLTLVKNALRKLVEQLRPEDAISIVTFGEKAELVLPRTQARQKQRILDAVNTLAPRGGTNVESGLNLGYRMADEAYSADAVNRVILCSDGVANVGSQGPDEILKTVKVFAARGIDLVTVGFGMGEYNDEMMAKLADNGNGSSYFVDTLAEAEKIFKEQLPPHFNVLARDAKVQVDFDPKVVSRYRLLGYEKRKIADKDFRNDAIDAGEVAHSTLVTALYEIQRAPGAHGDFGKVYLRWKDATLRHLPVIERNFPISEGIFAGSLSRTTPEFRLLACVAEFAELLKGTRWSRDGSYALVLAHLDRLPQSFQTRADVKELRELVAKAQELSVKEWQK